MQTELYMLLKPRKAVSEMADTHLMLACRHCGSRILIGKGYNGSYHTVCDDLSSKIDAFFSEHERGACADDFDCENNARNHFIVLEDDENLNSLKEELWRREGALKMLDQLNVNGLLNMTPRAYWELRDRTEGVSDMPEKTCSTCQCNKVCDHNKYGFENCGNYISCDLAPRAEAEKWFRECEELQGRVIELEKEAAFWEREADNAVDIAEGNIRAEIASGGTSCHWCENKIKADTVRKMQKMLKEKAVDVDMDDATLWMSCVPIDDIDQIAKQLTEDKA